MTNYPPGTTRRDLERAGIVDPPGWPPTCLECSNEIRNADPEEHEEWCDDKMITMDELAELHHERRNTRIGEDY